MGTLRSLTDLTGLVVNDIELGQPIHLDSDLAPVAADDPAAVWFAWDDSALPTGEAAADGTITVDQADLGD